MPARLSQPKLQPELFHAEPTLHEKELSHSTASTDRRVIVPSTNRAPGSSSALGHAEKHNAMAEARYYLSARAQKFVLFAISLIDKDDEKLEKTYTIHAAEFAAWAGLSEESVRRDFWDPRGKMRDKQKRKISIGKELLGEILVLTNYYVPERDMYVDLGTHWFHTVYPEKSSGPCGYLDVNFSPRLAPMLWNLRANYYRVNKIAIRKFDSRYTIRLFEWIESWSYQQKKRANRMNLSVDQVRSILGTDRPLDDRSSRAGLEALAGKPGFVRNGTVYERKLELIGHLRERALDPAVAEINAETDYVVTIVPKRQPGSKLVVSFDFVVFPKCEAALNQDSVPKEQITFTYPPLAGGAVKYPEAQTGDAEIVLPPDAPWPEPRAVAVSQTGEPASRKSGVAASSSSEDEAKLAGMVAELAAMYGLTAKQRDLAGFARSVGGCVTAAECSSWLKRHHDRVVREEPRNPARDFMAAVMGDFKAPSRRKIRPVVDPLAPLKKTPTPNVETRPTDTEGAEVPLSAEALAEAKRQIRLQVMGAARADYEERKTKQ